MNENADKLLTYEEVCEFLQVSPQSLLRFINQEDNPLPVLYISDKSPRVLGSELKSWLDRQTEIVQDKKEKGGDSNG